MKGARPTLSGAEAQELHQRARSEIDPSGAPYGCDIAKLGFDEWGRAFLSAMVVAGYLPHTEGLQLAYLGNFLWVRRVIGELLEAGVDGDALGVARSSAKEYRAMARQLHAEADRLDAASDLIEHHFPCGEGAEDFATSRDSWPAKLRMYLTSALDEQQ